MKPAAPPESLTASRERSISKSTYLMGLQCPKLLWFRYNAKDEIPAPDEQKQAIFDQGHQVGELAKKLFPTGIEITHESSDFDEALTQTKQALKLRKPLFEAAFQFNGGYARPDILNPVGRAEWDLIEVKSTTGVKDIHRHDLAFQAWVLTGARRCFLAHVNSKFIKHGRIDPKQFFTLEDVTAQTMPLSQTLESKLDEMFKTIRLRQHPETQIGPHCNAPYTCPLHDKCWGFLPAASVMTLYRGGAKGFKLLKDGVTALNAIPKAFHLTANQALQRQTVITGEPHIDRPALAAFLKQIRYPASFLDFETFNTAIPMFDGLKPYQQVPFQFSLHILCSTSGKPEHHTFLAAGTNDPRPEFMRRLRELLPAEGSIVAFNAPFEIGRLAECCEVMPGHQAWLENIKSRMVDLLLPFRGFRYYHPGQHGSASMKAVLPALTGRSYAGLEIQEGGMASREYMRVTFTPVPETERQHVRGTLEEYCAQDT